MKSLNAKKIAAIAATLLTGLAYAGQVSFQNVVIVNGQGTPSVQIVVGSHAQPSDGVVAANIAAVIGNLAFTSTPVTATVSNKNAVSCVVTTPTCTLTDQQVYFNEQGVSTPAGSYGFTALIGSVLNRAVKLSSPQYTKGLQSGSGTQYAYPETTSLQSSPAASPYTTAGFVPISTSVTANNNGGGVSFTQFTQNKEDNILRVSSANLPSLLSNAGSNGESEYLWVTGFPVYDQASGVKNFQLLDAAGAYQVLFNKPVPARTSSNTINNAAFNLLGQNWTIINYELPGTSGLTANVAAATEVSSTNTTAGGALELASSLSPMQTVYVGQNLTTHVNGANYSVELQDLGQPTSAGLSDAAVAVFKNGVQVNESSVAPGSIERFNVTGTKLFLKVNQTFAGLYAYQKWAKMQLYSNVYNVTSGKAFNQTNDPGWYTTLLWTNSSSSHGPADGLQSIILYNTTPTNLSPGQSLSFIQDPSAYKLTFVGQTLGPSSFDPLTLATSTSSSWTYQNLNASTAKAGLDITNVTEPAQLLTVTSSIPNAFSYAGQVNNTVTYDLTPYQLNEVNNETGVNSLAQNANALVTVSVPNTVPGNFVNNNNPLLVTVSGFTSKTASSPTSVTVTFNSLSGNTAENQTGVFLYNVTGIKPDRALPGLTVEVSANTLNRLATLVPLGPAVIYPLPGHTYSGLSVSAAGNVVYNQQNGQPTSDFVLSALPDTGTASPPVVGTSQAHVFFTYNVAEVAVPGNTAATDSLSVALVNATSGVDATPLFNLNYSGSQYTHNNVTYTAVGGASFNAQQGFTTEKGSVVESISPDSVQFNLAKAIDTLQFVVGVSTNTTSVTSTHQVGPVGVGQTVPGFPNLTVSKVNATCSFPSGSASCTVTGLDNLTAVATPNTTYTRVPLNTATTPLVVLDTNASSSQAQVVVGSWYVNSVAQQILASNPQLNTTISATSSNPVVVQAFGDKILVAGYTAQQTVQAGNTFIQDLLNSASSTT